MTAYQVQMGMHSSSTGNLYNLSAGVLNTGQFDVAYASGSSASVNMSGGSLNVTTAGTNQLLRVGSGAPELSPRPAEPFPRSHSGSEMATEAAGPST